MPKKDKLLEKLTRKPKPKNFTTKELDTLMGQCGCKKYPGGRGSAISFFHEKTGRILRFDGPHPGNELYSYQIDKVLTFLRDLGEI